MTAAAATTPARAVMTTGRTLLFAVTGGAAVGNLYWAQPLLELIGSDLGVSAGRAGLLVTTTQVGYALGIFLLVPLGDVHDRRRLVPLVMGCATLALLACALAPSFAVLLVATGLLGVTTVAGQVLMPLAGDLAAPERRGRVVATVASGLIIGILVSRTVSGLVAGAAGWRAIYGVAAAVTATLAVVMAVTLPRLPQREHIPYGRLLRSVLELVARERAVRWTIALAALGFASFTMLWTALTPHLAGAPFGYSVEVIGLFGLAGLAGALAAQRAGRLHDRGWSLPATGVAWALALVSWVVALVLGSTVAGVLAAILLLDVVIQGQNLLNGTRLFALTSEARSRVNTASVTCSFVAGAAGSALASVLWQVGGWSAVCVAGIALAAAALVVWAVGRRGPLVVPAGR